jgi:CBS domain-containing protein
MRVRARLTGARCTVQVRDLLRHKGRGVATVSPEVTVADLLSRLAENNVGAMVVTSESGSVRGIVSERDVVRALHRKGSGLLTETVSSIMTSEVTTATPDDSVESLARIMTESRIRHLPVIEDGRLAGIVSIGDVVKNRIDQLESERESLIGYIQSSG